MMSVHPFPFARTVEPVTNNPRFEFMVDCLDHLPPARQKRLIMRARSDAVDFLGDQDAEALMAVFGLKGA